MIVPFRALHLAPAVPCTTWACVLESPALRTVPVPDVLGNPWAYDVELTNGFHLLLAVFVLARCVLAWHDQNSRYDQNAHDEP